MNTQPPWAQDTLVTPVRMSTAREDPNLAKYVADHYAYVFSFDAVAGQPEKLLSFNGALEMSSDFYMTQVVVSLTDQDNIYTNLGAPFFMTLKDNVTQYTIMNNVYAGAFSVDRSISLLNMAAQRTIWIEPYGFGAGGSFTLDVRVPQWTPGLNGFGAYIIIEGFKYYQIGDENG